MKNILKNEIGITLVALIITIIILLILAGITLSTLTGENGLFSRAKEAKIKTQIAGIIEQIQIDIYDKQLENQGDMSDDTLKAILEKYGVLSKEGEKLIDKTLTTTKENYEIKVSDIFNATTKKDITKDPVIEDKSGAEKPSGVITGKQYVTWEWNDVEKRYDEKLSTTQPDNWYDYDNGKWANIKTTNNGLEAYWVWIPRYEYIVPTSTTATEIEVKFISKTQTIPDTDKNYIIHPAFTNEGNGGFGELDGIWVAKFEASSNTQTPDTNYGGGNDTNLKIQVKPGVQSWRGNIELKDVFTLCRKMTENEGTLEGATVDSHLMKNIEWGAVAILSQSKYGIFNLQSSTGANGDSTYQIWNNSNGYNTYKNIYTGYAGNSKDASTTHNSTTATNVYEYNTVNGSKASTTGTVYGIYDMAGGSYDLVAGCLKGTENSLFGVTTENLKYVDVYSNLSNDRFNFDGAKIGDATIETSGWNSDTMDFVTSKATIFFRGRCLQQ